VAVTAAPGPGADGERHEDHRHPLSSILAGSLAQQPPAIDPARSTPRSAGVSDRAADWQSRLVPDETMRQCSARNAPAAVAERSGAENRDRYPPDGKLLGDWKGGAPQSGYGLRFTDYRRGPKAAIATPATR
jgi:hypothetical protein